MKFFKLKNKNRNLIRLSKSVLSKEEKKAVNKVINEGYLGMGKHVQNFENELQSMIFKRPTACVVNGTAALHLALQACGIGEGDEVLVQSITYLASFQAITASGAKPISCDIDLLKLTLDLEDARKKITSRTKAIMPVHYAGDLGAYQSIYDLARDFNLRVIEDAAHAFGGKKNGQYIGSFGDIVCFSFDGIKNITCGEGGCVTSNDLNVINKIKDSRLLGVNKDTEQRFSGKRSWEFDVLEKGWRYHMSDLMASIGSAQLKKLDKFSKKRQNIATYYDTKLKDLDQIYIFNRDYKSIVPHIYPIKLGDKIKREHFKSYLEKRQIQTGIHYKPNHLLTLFKKNDLSPLLKTESIYKKIISLPLHPELKYKEIDYIVDIIKEYLNSL